MRRQRGHDRVRDLLAAERRFVERHDDAVDAERRRRAGDEQQIAGGSFDDLLEPAAQPGELASGGSSLGGAACRADRGALRRRAFSSVTSASRSSGGVIRRLPQSPSFMPIAIPSHNISSRTSHELRVHAAHRFRQQRLVQEPDERRDLPEDIEQRA